MMIFLHCTLPYKPHTVVSQESIPRSLSDTYLTGLYIDRNNTDTVYYATQMGIHSYDQVTKGMCVCTCIFYACRSDFFY